MNFLMLNSEFYSNKRKLFKQIWIVLIITTLPGCNGIQLNVTQSNTTSTTPIFDDFLSNNLINCQIGQTVLLPCTVHNLKSKVVSWIRSRDLHILTSAVYTFSTDNRFEVVHNQKTNFWGLKIRGVRLSDSGKYECQVNTEPKMSMAINLQVNVLDIMNLWRWEAKIEAKEVIVKDGYPVSLICKIFPITLSNFSLSNFFKPHIRWLHNGRNLTFDASRAISIDTIFEQKDMSIVTTLRLSKAKYYDSGQYKCTQIETKPATVELIVIHGEYSEAMQQDSPLLSLEIVPCINNSLLLLLLYIIYCIR